MSDTYTLWLCQCCMIAAVHGEPCHCIEDAEDRGSDREHPEGLLGKLEGEHITMGLLREQHDSDCMNYHTQLNGSPYECDCETRNFVMFEECGGCGSTLGGERHAFTGWGPEFVEGWIED